MGKRYYCDYCNKTMVSTPSIVKTHNKGVVHQKIVNEHYQRFKDPETILKEESVKKPCSRHIKGECQFGSICRFSHYSREQLNELQKYVQAKTKTAETSQPLFQDLYQKLEDERTKKKNNDNTDCMLLDPNGISHVLPWAYHPMTENDSILPPSLKRLKAEDFVNIEYKDWGWN